MKTVLSILLLVSLLLNGAMVVEAKDFQSLCQTAEKFIKLKRPDWKLVAKEERKKEISYLWGPEKAHVMLMIFYGDSKQEAVDKMRFMFKFLSVGPVKNGTILVTKHTFGRVKTGAVMQAFASERQMFISILSRLLWRWLKISQKPLLEKFRRNEREDYA